MNYKMLKEHDKHFEMLHPDGTSFKVAKSGLTEAHMAKVRKLKDGTDPKDFADDQAQDPSSSDGSSDVPQDVSADSSIDQQPDAGAQPPPPPAAPTDASVAPTAPSGASGDWGGQDSGEEEAPVASGANPHTQPYQPEGGIKTASLNTGASDPATALQSISQENQKTMGALNDKITASTQAAQTAANIQAKAYDDQTKQMRALETQTQQRYAALDKEQAQLTQDVVNQKIEPNRVWNNASTGNKILAGIGILLSGLGSGLTGGPNLALKVIDKTIDDDIAAQKSELGKKENLLSQNYRKYGDLRAATLATQNQLMAITNGQVAAAAARAAGPAAAANGQALVTQNNLKMNENNRELAMMGLKNDVLSGNAASGKGPSPALIESLGLTPLAVNTPDGTKFALTPKDAEEVRGVTADLGEVENTVDRMIARAKKVGTTVPWSANDDLNKSDQAHLTEVLGKLSGVKKISDKEIDLRKEQISNPGAIMTGKAIQNLEEIKRFAQDTRNAQYASRLRSYNPAKSTTRDVNPGFQSVKYNGQ